jgi:hypothetical protein
MISLGVRYLEYAEIASVANSFLRDRQLISIPINIEWIIESVYRTDIIPLPSLQIAFFIEGFSTPSFSAIYVDDYVWKSNENRYRFTLAHELGHHLMHSKYLSMLGGYSSVKQWAQVVEQIDPRDHSKMEFQANSFAGLLLVPPNHLETEFVAGLQSLDSELDQARTNGLKRRDYVQYVLEQLAYSLSPGFQVSTDVMAKRIQYDCLDELIL